MSDTTPTYCRRCKCDFDYCECPPLCPTCGKDKYGCPGYHPLDPIIDDPMKSAGPPLVHNNGDAWSSSSLRPYKFLISKRQRCGLCAYWDIRNGACHRFPQTVIKKKHHWCGEWQDNGEPDDQPA